MKNNISIQEGVQYQWNQSWPSPVAHTDINLVVEELRIIEEAFGEVTAARLVESSKNHKSILHNYFEWDNEKAATKWRYRQASKLLSCIEVRVVKEGKPVIMQAYQIKQIPFSPKGDSKYTKFNVLTEDNADYIQRIAIKELGRIKNKLISNGYSVAVGHIDKAIVAIQEKYLASEKGSLIVNVGNKTELAVV